VWRVEFFWDAFTCRSVGHRSIFDNRKKQSAPHRSLERQFKKLSRFIALVFTCSTCFPHCCLRSNIIPRILWCFVTLMMAVSLFVSLQKCMQTVLVDENRKLFPLFHLVILLTVHCSVVRIEWYWSRSVSRKSSSHRRNRWWSLELLQLMGCPWWRAKTGWHSALPFVLLGFLSCIFLTLCHQSELGKFGLPWSFGWRETYFL
jgi:hypothetical protein